MKSGARRTAAMPTTDTTEKGLEELIVAHLTGKVASGVAAAHIVREGSSSYNAGSYVEGDPRDYNRDTALDTVKLFAFLQATQPKILKRLDIEGEGTKRTEFFQRLQGEIAKRGVVDVLRKG